MHSGILLPWLTLLLEELWGSFGGCWSFLEAFLGSFGLFWMSWALLAPSWDSQSAPQVPPSPHLGQLGIPEAPPGAQNVLNIDFQGIQFEVKRHPAGSNRTQTHAFKLALVSRASHLIDTLLIFKILKILKVHIRSSRKAVRWKAKEPKLILHWASY